MGEVSFGEWLKRRRKARGLTQEQLAQEIHCSTSALRKIEAEQRRPSAQIVEQLAAVFNIASNERRSFLKFARGDWDAAPTGVIESAPWRVSPAFEAELEDLSNPKTHLATFLFTDIEGSAKFWENFPEKMKIALQRHHEILQEAISSNGGDAFQVVGDAFCVVFPTTSSAISAAVIAQRALYAEQWDLPFPIRVRIGIHTGTAEPTSDDSPTGGYASNHTLNRVARILSAGHGGQILLSLATKELVKDSLPADIQLRDVGEHHLKNLNRPEHLFQLISADLPADFPPLNTLDSHRHNLPLQLTSFIGREREIAEVKYLLSATRLLTLIGPGGTGKTRLSIQVAGELLAQYPDGTCFVEFAPLSDPLLIPRTTAIAIGLRDEPQRPVIDMLCDYLRGKQLLLILDNCEHLVEACAQLADRLLHACPQIRILASSREALGITGETSYLVPSLKLPDLQNLPSIEILSQGEAVRLFIERASAATQNFKVTNDNASSVAQICHRLDGMPLAIELAAGKIRALSAGQIAQRLDDRFHLLTGGSRTAMPRHQTLQAAIEWSYDLLSPAERTLFRRLSVFVNGWTLEAAESVCSDKDTTSNDALKTEDILELLSQLVNKSLAITEERHSEVRYHMLETIHHFAHEELLETGDANKVQTHHLDFFVKLSEEAEPRLLGIEQLIWLDRLEYELDNIRAALEWSLKSGNAGTGLRLAGALLRFWDHRNHCSEGRERLATLMAHPEATVQTKELAKALYAAGFLAHVQNDRASASTLYAEGLTISRELGDRQAIGYFLVGLARIGTRYLGDLQPRLLLVDESLKIFEELGDRRGIAASLGGLGILALEQDDYATASSHHAESITIYRELGDKIHLAFSLASLADVMMIQSDYDQPVMLYEESLAIFRERGHKWGITWTLNALGEVARCQGNYNHAKILYEEGLALSREIGDKSRIAASLHNLAYVSHHQGNYPEMAALFTKALFMSREIADTYLSFLCLAGLAGEAEATGRLERSARLCGSIEAFFNISSYRMAPADHIEYQRNVASLRAQLDEATLTAAWAEGRAMTIDEAIAYALEK